MTYRLPILVLVDLNCICLLAGVSQDALIPMTYRLPILVLVDLKCICLVAGVRNLYDLVIMTHITFFFVSLGFLVDRVQDS